MSHFKVVQCAECGVDMSVGSNKRLDAYCQSCKLQRYIDNMASLIMKSGPQYEANVKATRDYYARKARGGTPESQPPKTLDCD